jgi:hypothetical protein
MIWVPPTRPDDYPAASGWASRLDLSNLLQRLWVLAQTNHSPAVGATWALRRD